MSESVCHILNDNIPIRGTRSASEDARTPCIFQLNFFFSLIYLNKIHTFYVALALIFSPPKG